jgi:hypothetical protein
MSKTIFISAGVKVVLKANISKTAAQFANGYKPSRSSISRRTSSMQFSSGNKVIYSDLHSLFINSISGNTISGSTVWDFNSSLMGGFTMNATILFRISSGKNSVPFTPGIIS